MPRKDRKQKERKKREMHLQRSKNLEVCNFRFHPVNMEWQQNLCRLFPGLKPKFYHQRIESVPLSTPLNLRHIGADGNCFFRSISYILTGCEDFHLAVRAYIVDHMLSHIDLFSRLIGSSVEAHILRHNIDRPAQWATEYEVFAAAHMLETDIYVYSKHGDKWKWMKHSVNFVDPDVQSAERSIYLQHTGTSHFDVVVNVTTDMSQGLQDYFKDQLNRADMQYSHHLEQELTSNILKRKFPSEHDTFSLKKKPRKYAYTAEQNIAKSVNEKLRYNTDPKFQNKKICSSKEKYNIKKHREAKKSASVKKYADNAEHRNVVKKASVQKYAENIHHRDLVKEQSVKHYAQNAQHRNRVKKASVKKYAEDTQHQNRVKKASVKKYAEDTQHKTKVKMASVKKYAEDPQHKNRVKKASVKKYAEDTPHKNRVKKASVKKYAEDTPHKNRVKKASVKKYAEDTPHKNRVKKTSVKKYAEDPQHRNKVKKTSVKKYAEDTRHRNKVKKASVKKYAEDTRHRNLVKQLLQHKYKSSKDFRDKKKSNSKKRFADKQASLKSIENVISRFKQQIKEGPTFVCTVCIRTCFRKQVIHCNRMLYTKTPELTELSQRCITGKYTHQCDKDSCQTPTNKCKEWICLTCHRHLLRGSMPPQAYVNGLELEEIPDCMNNLNSLEKQLISLRIPFLKLLKLPRGNQRGVKGAVTTVPNDITKVTSALPRTLNDADVILVKLKRRQSDKGHYLYQYVNPTNVEESVKYLIKNNYWYSGVNFDSDWMSDEYEPVDSCVVSTVSQKQQITSMSGIPETTSDISSKPQSESYTSNNDDEQSESSDHESNEQSDKPHGESGDDNMDIERDKPHGKSYDDETNVQYNDTSLQPDDIGQDIMDQLQEKIFSLAPAEGNKPESMFTQKGTEAMAFPCQFPNGKNTLNETREVKLSPSKYFNARLFCADNRFSSDSLFIFFAQYFCELNFVLSNISIAIRKGKQTLDNGQKITAKMLTNTDHVKNILTVDQGFRFLQPVRGTPPYWERTLKDLFAMIRQLGIPTWFATFSAADLRWDDILQAILDQNDDPRKIEELDYLEKCELLRDNSVTAGRMFDRKASLLLHQVIMSPAQPIGKVIDFFVRTEFQQRGSPHIHCMFWVEGAPKFNHDSDQEICNFIDNYISCAKPDQVTDPELHKIVTEVQMHSRNHSKSCRKHGSECRFHFPRPPVTSTHIMRNQPSVESSDHSELTQQKSTRSSKDKLKDVWQFINTMENDDMSLPDILSAVDLTEDDYVEALQDLNKRDTVMLKRSPGDIWVNNYNEHLIRAWNANMDLQFVLDPYSCVVYILSYISKAEHEMGEILKEARQEAREGNEDIVQQMRTLGTVYIHNREVSCQEAVYRVCGLKLKDCSRNIVFIPCGSDTIKISKPIQQIRATLKGEEDSDDIWMNSIHDKYRNRPLDDLFENMCLASFVSQYRLVPSTQVPASSSLKQKRSIFALRNDLGFIQKRGKEAIVRYPRFKRDKRPEQFYMTQLQLYLPHRSDNDIKPTIFETFEQFLKCGKTQSGDSVLSVVENNRSLFEKDSDTLESAWDDLKKNGMQEDAWSMLAPQAEENRLQDIEENVRNISDIQCEEIAELATVSNVSSKTCTENVNNLKFNKKMITPLLQTLNNKQKDVFYTVREWCLEKAWNKHPNPFYYFVTGGAGTGKSHLIKCIYYEANRILQPLQENPDNPTVLLTAPTGTAAFNISGSTIHSTFCIGINPKLPYKPLSENRMNTLRSKLGNIQILIIDEISMVDMKLLAYIHGRLSQIKQTSSRTSFGNVSVLAVGDFFQIPPVKGTPLYKTVIGDFSNLWFSNFSCASLDEVMRQKNDLPFAAMLNRLRIQSKSSSLDPADLASLQSRIVDCGSEDYPRDALHIFPTNKECEIHNQEMLLDICNDNPIFEIPALDFKKDPTTGKTTIVQKPCSSSSNNLPAILFLAVGARVILTRNIDTEDGLANGAFGTVTSIVQSDTQGRVISVYVHFDNPAVGRSAKGHHSSVKIQRFEDNLVENNIIRLQFPFKLGWASTTHKVQGCTTDKAVVSLKNTFQPGMAYVALSRVTKLTGLNIIDFKESAIYASDLVKDAIAKMPEFKSSVNLSSLSQGFIITHHNTEGIMNNYQNIISSGILTDTSILCLSETWIDGPTAPKRNLIPGFQLYHKSRYMSYCADADTPFCELHLQDKGGVCICVKEDVPHKELKLTTNNIEYIAVQIFSPNIIICCVYRPPSLAKNIFCQQMKVLLEEISTTFITPCYVLGDFNENYMKPGKISDLFKTQQYEQLVKKPTTLGHTVLDLIFLNEPNTEQQAYVKPIFYGYHEAVCIEI